MSEKKFTLIQKFTIAFLVLLMIHWTLFVIYPNGVQKTIFFAEGRDFMADFLNLLRYMADGNPYDAFDGERIYLPLGYMLIYPFSKLDNYAVMSLSDLWGSHIVQISFTFFTLVSVFAFYFALKTFCEKYNVNKIILIPLLLSGFFIRAVERGNLILISASCSIFYLALYDSESKLKRKLAVIFLALSAALKVYPALFGIMYLRKKMYREFIEAVILSILLGLLPFLFFDGGFSNIPALIKNLAINSRNYGSITRGLEPLFNMRHYVFRFFKLLGLAESHAAFIAYACGYLQNIFALIALIFAWRVKNEYLSLILCALGIIFLPANTGSYCGLYLFPAVIMMFAQTKISVSHLVFYLVYLSPIQFGIIHKGEVLGITWIFLACITALFMLANLYAAFRLRKQ